MERILFLVGKFLHLDRCRRMVRSLSVKDEREGNSWCMQRMRSFCKHVVGRGGVNALEFSEAST